MSLTTNLYFFRPDDDAPPLHSRDVMDAIVGRLREHEWRGRIAEHGALRVAMSEFAWLFDQRGVETLFDPPVRAFLVAVRRFGNAPVYLCPLDLLRRFTPAAGSRTNSKRDCHRKPSSRPARPTPSRSTASSPASSPPGPTRT